MKDLFLCDNARNCEHKYAKFHGTIDNQCPHCVLHEYLSTCKINLVGRGIGNAECS